MHLAFPVCRWGRHLIVDIFLNPFLDPCQASPLCQYHKVLYVAKLQEKLLLKVLCCWHGNWACRQTYVQVNVVTYHMWHSSACFAHWDNCRWHPNRCQHSSLWLRGLQCYSLPNLLPPSCHRYACSHACSTLHILFDNVPGVWAYATEEAGPGVPWWWVLGDLEGPILPIECWCSQGTNSPHCMLTATQQALQCPQVSLTMQGWLTGTLTKLTLDAWPCPEATCSLTVPHQTGLPLLVHRSIHAICTKWPWCCYSQDCETCHCIENTWPWIPYRSQSRSKLTVRSCQWQKGTSY